MVTINSESEMPADSNMERNKRNKPNKRSNNIQIPEIKELQCKEIGFIFNYEFTPKQWLEQVLKNPLAELVDLNRWEFNYWSLDSVHTNDLGSVCINIYFTKRQEQKAETPPSE